ncbi:MAG: hypothetical protein CMJ58_10670 [Planctomycetaceae bacterium]|nr:hypothetical protein [Planctomycetaceae bacterium]
MANWTRIGLTLGAVASAASVVAIAWACGGYGDFDLADRADELRAAGPDGLQTALAAYDAASDEEHRAELAAIVDLVAQQRGAVVSRLYWYTDLDAAQKAAAAAGKPILSLRLLGRLTDEYSCANSRFFRTALYSNREVSAYLRDHFVLHWKTVRPVPRITIDFGDGRQLDRTVTGNSVHYILDSNGTPLDALPGMYGPDAFLAWLERGFDQLGLSPLTACYDPERLIKYHQQRLAAIDEQFAGDTAAAGVAALALAEPEFQRVPTAAAAARRAFSKTAVEAPLVAVTTGDRVEDRLSDDQWQAIAALHGEEAQLDESSRAVIRRELPDAVAAGARAGTKRVVEDPLLRIVQSFESSIALDTVKNEYLLHRQIHQWFVAGDVPADLDVLNERVYAELFLTPSDDPWLGLAPADAYTALDGGGLTLQQ